MDKTIHYKVSEQLFEVVHKNNTEPAEEYL